MLRSSLGSIPTVWHCLANAFVAIRNQVLMTFGGPDECGVCCPTRAEATIDLATAYLHLLRNLCAAVPANQMRASQLEFYKSAEIILAYECSWLITTVKPCSQIRAKVTASVNMGTQMLANMMTGNEQILNALWPRFFNKGSDLLIQILKASDSKTCKFVLMFIYNCTFKNKDRTELLVSTPVGRSLLILLLREAENLFEQDSPNFDIILYSYGIIVNMIELDDTSKIMQAICLIVPRTASLSREHLTFLKMLDGMVESRLGSGNPSAVAALSNHAFSNETSSLFCRLFRKLVKALERVLDAVLKEAEMVAGAQRKACDDSDETSMNVDQTSNPSPTIPTVDVDCIFIFLRYFTRALSGEDDPAIGSHTTDRRKLVMKEGLGAALLALLTMLARVRPPGKGDSKGAAVPEEAMKKLNEVLMLRVDAMKVVANLCYGVVEVQDEFRCLGGIPIVLNHCRIDDSNPFLREWSIFAVRNLCDNNPKNQALIASLEARGMAPDDGTLAAAGLKARVTSDGKVKVGPVMDPL
ncbi:spinocerebellar ataxia type 10 protein domain-containing protein [Chytridium lagenaria]|nr:spinocerebellar ataxia type 10 protein domain-containing protein [Chytridium lagenaria]